MSNPNPNQDRSRLGPFRKRHLVAAGVFLLVMFLLTIAAQNIYYYVTPKIVVSRPKSGVIEKSLRLNLNRAESDSEEVFFALRLPSGLSLYVSDLLVLPGDDVTTGQKLVQFNEKSVEDIRAAYADALTAAQKQLDGFADSVSQQTYAYQKQVADIDRDIAALTGKIYASQSDEQAVKSAENGIKSLEAQITKLYEERVNVARLVDAGDAAANTLKQHDTNIAEQEAALAARRIELIEAQDKAAANYTEALAELNRRKADLARDYSFNSARNTYAGKTKAELEADVEKAAADIEVFDAYITEDGCYLSPREGKLERFYLERATMFSGMARIAAFSRASNTVAYMTTLAKDDELLAAGKPLTVLINGKRIPFTIESKEPVGEGARLMLRADTKTLADASIDPATSTLDAELLVSSERYETIVPSAAIAYAGGGECVYIIHEQEGYFGKQTYISAVNVTLMESGGGNVAVQASGYLNSSARIVVSWDRELQNLGKVIIVAEQ